NLIPRDPAGNPMASVGQAINIGASLYTGIDPLDDPIVQPGVSYSWRVTGGPYTGATTIGTSLSFTPQAGGTYVATLTATDAHGATSASVAIDVSPAPPAVNISRNPAAVLQGAVDPTFGNGGTVTTSLGTDDDEGGQIFALPNGKVLVVGYTDLGTNDSNGVLALLRYNADGTLDSTYQNGAKPSVPGIYFPSSDVAVGPEGQVAIVQGSTVWQFNPDGSLDTAFNGGSITTFQTNFNGGISFDGDKILVWGGIGMLILQRYNTDGSLDTGFGVNGTVLTDLGLTQATIRTNSLTVQPDGSILVGGATDGDGFVSVALDGFPFTDPLPFLARFTPNGAPDMTFGPAHSGWEIFVPGASFGGVFAQPNVVPFAVDLASVVFQELDPIGRGTETTRIALTQDGKTLAWFGESL